MTHSLASTRAWAFDPPLWRRTWWVVATSAAALLVLLGGSVMVWGWLNVRIDVQLAGNMVLMAGVAIQIVISIRTLLLARRERLGEE